MSKCTPLSSARVVSIKCLVPPPELVDALDRPRVVVVEVFDHGGDRFAGQNALADRFHVALDAMQLVDAPRVRLVEVEVDAVERCGEKLVAIAPDGITGIGDWRVLIAQIRAETRVRGSGLIGSLRESGVVGAARGKVREIRRRATPGLGLVRACECLAARGDDTTRDTLAQRRFDAGEAGGHARHALGGGLPVVVGVERHQVEALANDLNRAADDPQGPEVLVGVVEVDLVLEPVAHDRGRQAIGIVGLRCAVQRGNGLACELHSRGLTRRREVGHLVVVRRDPEECRAARRPRGVFLDVTIGDAVHPVCDPVRHNDLHCGSGR